MDRRHRRRLRHNASYFYDYAGQDPINAYDLQGTWCPGCHWFKKHVARGAEGGLESVVDSTLGGQLLDAAQTYGTINVGGCIRTCLTLSVHKDQLYVSTGGVGSRSPRSRGAPARPVQASTLTTPLATKGIIEGAIGVCGGINFDKRGAYSYSFGLSALWGG